MSLLITARAIAGDFTFHPTELGPPLVGFGAQLNPYVYCTPNWGEVNDENVKDYERKVIDLAPQHVRIFCLNQWFDPKATDPIAKTDRGIKQSFIRTVELCQRAGATVNLTLWYGPFSVRKDNNPPPTTFEDAARGFASMLHELIDVHHLSAVRYVTIQNEVNDVGPNGKRFRLELDEYEKLYRMFDAELRKRNLRDKVQIVAGDLVGREQELWIAYMGEHMADFCDGWSMHAYWDFWDDGKIVRRLGGFADLVAALPAQQRKPMYAMEFGVRGRKADFKTNDPGNADDGSPIATTPLHASQMARFIIESINRGYVAAVAWNMDDSLYDHPMKYGLLGTPKEGWPIKPAYQIVRLFTHTSRPGWRALRIEGSAENVILAGMKGGDDVTVYALNYSDHPASIKLIGLDEKRIYHRLTWSGADPQRIATAAKVNATTAVLPALSLSAFTTLAQE